MSSSYFYPKGGFLRLNVYGILDNYSIYTNVRLANRQALYLAYYLQIIMGRLLRERNVEIAVKECIPSVKYNWKNTSIVTDFSVGYDGRKLFYDRKINQLLNHIMIIFVSSLTPYNFEKTKYLVGDLCHLVKQAENLVNSHERIVNRSNIHGGYRRNGNIHGGYARSRNIHGGYGNGGRSYN